MLGALHRTAVEIERDAAEIIAQGRSGAVDHVEFQIRLEGFEGRIGKNFLYLVNGLGLVDADFVYRRITLTQEEEVPIDAGIVAQQFGVGHLMIVAFDIAQLGGGVRGLGDAGFDTEHLFHLARCICLGRTGHDKKLLDVGAISLTYLARGLVILQIVVTFAERQAALVDLHEVHLGILDVGAATYANHARNAATFQMVGEQKIGGFVVDGAHLLQRCTNGFVAFTVTTHAVHGKTIERTDFLCQTAGSCGLLCQILNQRADTLLIDFFELVELPVTSVFGRERMGFHPTAAGILIEILAGTSCKIHISTIKRGRRCLCNGAYGPNGQGGQKMFDSFHGLSIEIDFIFEGGFLEQEEGAYKGGAFSSQ